MISRQSRAWSRLRALKITEALEAGGVVECWRCEQPLDVRTEPCDLGHVIDAAIMTEQDQLIVRLEHRACSRSAGTRLQRELSRRGGNRAWQSGPLR